LNKKASAARHRWASLRQRHPTPTTTTTGAPPVAARQAGVARDYLKRAARIDELNGHPPGSDGPTAPALKRHNGGRVLVFVVGAFAEMSEDMSRICGIIAHDLARTHVSYYNDDAKRTKGMYRRRIQKA